VSAAASAAVCGAVDVVVGVAAHGMTDGTQELDLEPRIRPIVELGQTGLDS